MIVFTQDKHRILKHCQKDPVLFAYYIGDLDDRHFAKCQWVAAYSDSRYMDDLVLLYHGSIPSTMMVLELTPTMQLAMHELIDLLPDQLYLHANNEKTLEALSSSYEINALRKCSKMKLDTFLPAPASEFDERIERLGLSNVEELREFYPLAFPDGIFIEEHLGMGKYFGYRENERIVGAVGVHILSDEHKLAVIGSCAVDPGFRGNGIATALMNRLVSELVREQKLVCLNVVSDNQPAIRCYQKLGFAKTHDYFEARLKRRVQ